MKKLFFGSVFFVLSLMAVSSTLFSAAKPAALGLTGQQGASGLYFPPQAYTTLFATNTILQTSNYVVLTTSGGFPGNIKLTSTPNISTTTALNTTAAGTTAVRSGLLLILSGGNTAQITLQDNSTLANSGLNLIGATTVITSTTTATFIFNGTTGRWQQVRGFN